MRTTIAAALLFGLLACAHSAPSVADDGKKPAPAAPAAPAAPVKKDQPPSVKLKLGHYSNSRLGIGAVIDLSEKIDNVAKLPPAKVKFDGEAKVWHLTAQHGPQDRIDYVRENGHVMLHAWADGRRSVYVVDPDTDKASDEIQMNRDGDADPL